MQKHNEKAQQLVRDQLQARLKKVVTEYFKKEKGKNVTVSDKELKKFVNTSIRYDSVTLAIEKSTAVLKISAKANDSIEVLIRPQMLGRVGRGGVGGGVGGLFAGAGAGAGIGALSNWRSSWYCHWSCHWSWYWCWFWCSSRCWWGCWNRGRSWLCTR